MAKMYVRAERFVEEVLRAHKNGEDWDTVASRLGVKKASCTVRASILRKQGIDLPSLTSSGRGGKKTDFVALAKMVSDYQANSAVDDTTETTEAPETSEINEVGNVDVAEVNEVLGQQDQEVSLPETQD